MSAASTPSPADPVAAWVDAARRTLRAGGSLREADLDRLLADARGSRFRLRQRLLYLHTVNPSIYADLVAAAIHEPVTGAVTEIDPQASEMPYRSVHDAIVDGWRVVHFPQQRAPFDDREIDVIGHEFILEKLEEFDD